MNAEMCEPDCACPTHAVDAVTRPLGILVPQFLFLAASSELDLNFERLFTSFNPKPKCLQRADAKAPKMDAQLARKQ